MGLPITLPNLGLQFGGGPSQASVDGGAISNEGYTGAFNVGSGQARQTNQHPVTATDTSSGPSMVPNYSNTAQLFGWQTILAVGAVIAVLIVIKKKL